MMLGIVILFNLCVTAFANDKHVTVLVNRVKYFEGEYKDNIEYRYFDGDRVDVNCFGDCILSISHDYVDKRSVDKVANTSFTSTRWGAALGMRISLTTAHDGSRITCKCPDGRLAPVNLTFILEHFIDDFMNLKINGLSLRPQNRLPTSRYVVYHALKKFPTIDVQMISDVNRDDVMVIHRNLLSSTTFPTSYSRYGEKLIYEARNKTTSLLLRTVEINFQYLDNQWSDRVLLELDVPKIENMIELYQWDGNVVMYYNYEEGDTVTLNCNRTEYFIRGYCLRFDAAASRNESIVKHMRLFSADHNTAHDCTLLEWDCPEFVEYYDDYGAENTVEKNIHIVFRKISALTNSTISTSIDDSTASTTMMAPTEDSGTAVFLNASRSDDIDGTLSTESTSSSF